LSDTVRRIVVACLALGAFRVAAAADGGRPVTIVPLAGYRGGATLEADLPGTPGIDAEPSATFGIEVDVATRPDAWMEMFYDHQTLSFDDDHGSGAAPFDLVVDYLQVGGRYQPGKDAFRPYVSAALGLTLYDADGGQVEGSTGFSGSIGGGFDASMSERISFRAELRGYATFSDTTVAGTCGAGCSVRLQSSGWYQVGARIGLVFRM
jgi:hypothetical protein